MTRSPLFASVTGLAALAVLLQGLWAGLFLRGRNGNGGWVTVHNVGGVVAVVLAIVGLGVALVQLRDRRDLVVGSTVLLVLLLAEYGLGQAISDHGAHSLTALHVPLALLIMAVATWLPLRARTGAPATPEAARAAR